MQQIGQAAIRMTDDEVLQTVEGGQIHDSLQRTPAGRALLAEARRDAVHAIRHWRCDECGGLASTPAHEDACECGPCGGRRMDVFELAVLEADVRVERDRTYLATIELTNSLMRATAERDRFRLTLEKIERACPRMGADQAWWEAHRALTEEQDG